MVVTILHIHIWCLGPGTHHGISSSLNRRSKKLPEKESEAEYNTLRASGAREEKSRKKRKMNKRKTATCWKKRRKRKEQTSNEEEKREKKRKTLRRL